MMFLEFLIKANYINAKIAFLSILGLFLLSKGSNALRLMFDLIKGTHILMSQNNAFEDVINNKPLTDEDAWVFDDNLIVIACCEMYFHTPKHF